MTSVTASVTPSSTLPDAPPHPALDAEQRAIVSFTGPRLKVLGRAGTGKTTVLLERARWLVGRGVDPAELLVFVQDRRQARELRETLVRRLGRSVAGPSVFTFHGFCWSLLTRGFAVEASDGAASALGYQLAGYADEPVLLPAFDQRAFVQELLREEDPRAWPVNGALLRSRAFAGEVRDFLLRVQERLETPESLRALAEARGRGDWAELARFYERYLRRLEDPVSFGDPRPRLDFARVLSEARRVLGEHPRLADDLKRAYPHILVDDFEEANRAETSVLEALMPSSAEGGRSAVIAGDPDGSVYAFRGADPSCLRDLAAEERRLTRVYRGSDEPQVRLYAHVTEEAKGIVAELRSAAARGTPWGDMAVVLRDYRTLLGPLRRELNRADVPYVVDGEALQLAHDPVVRPVLSLLAIACRRPGHEELWPELLTSELGGLAAHELVQLRRAVRLQGRRLDELCDGFGLETADLPGEIATKLRRLCSLVADVARGSVELRADECFWELWKTSDWFARLVEEEDHRRLDSLTTLADALARYVERRGRDARMADFMDTLSSAEFAPESVRLDRAEDGITITTAHGAKGREFELAVVGGCVEGMWPDPSRRNLLLDIDLLAGDRDHAARAADALLEEERLFRLAASRAHRLVLTGQRAGGSERSSAEPSRFLRLVVGSLPHENAAVPELLLTPREVEIAWRRTLADSDAAAPRRLAALWGLARLPGVDPARWWWGRAWTSNPTPVSADRRQTSYTRFAHYENCPLQYLLGQVLGLDPETSYQMAFGSLIHGLLEDLEAGRLPKDLDVLAAEVDRRWRPEAFPAGAVSEFLRRDAREILERYLRREVDNGHRTLAVEKEFEFEVAGWLVRGKIDRIDALERDGLRLVDYKTSSSWKRDSEVADDLQLLTYMLACVRDDDLRRLGAPKVAELVYVRNEYKDHITRASINRPRDAEDGTPWDEAIERRIAALLEGIEGESFAPSPDADCRYCSFKTLCPMWPEGEELTTR